MKRLTMMSGAILALTLLAFTGPARAGGPPTPQEIAQQCVQTLAQKSNLCAQRNAMRAMACVAKVNELQDEGQNLAAFLVAAECVQRTVFRSQVCINQLDNLSDNCSVVLLDLDAPALAELVNEAGQTAKQNVAESRQLALQAIFTALND